MIKFLECSSNLPPVKAFGFDMIFSKQMMHVKRMPSMLLLKNIVRCVLDPPKIMYFGGSDMGVATVRATQNALYVLFVVVLLSTILITCLLLSKFHETNCSVGICFFYKRRKMGSLVPGLLLIFLVFLPVLVLIYVNLYYCYQVYYLAFIETGYNRWCV